MFFNKLYNKLKPPKVLELNIGIDKDQELIRMISQQITPAEQKLILIQKMQ